MGDASHKTNVRDTFSMSTNETPKKRGRKATFDRSDVLDKMVTLFWSKGYDETSHNDMRDLTGLSGSSLYNAFGDKPAIFDSVLERYHDLTREIVEPLDNSTGGLDAIVNWCDFLAMAVANPDAPKGCLMVASMTQPVGQQQPVRERTDRYLDRIRAALTAALERAAANGEIEGSTVQRRAALTESSFIGIMVNVRIRPTPDRALAMVNALRHTVEEWRTV